MAMTQSDSGCILVGLHPRPLDFVAPSKHWDYMPGSLVDTDDCLDGYLQDFVTFAVSNFHLHTSKCEIALVCTDERAYFMAKDCKMSCNVTDSANASCGWLDGVIGRIDLDECRSKPL